MSWTRRTFLGATATSLVIGAVGGVSGRAAAAPALALRRSSFAPLVGRTMVVAHGRRRSRVRLADIRDVLGARPGSDASFILQFRSSRPLTDGLYTLSHARSGSHRVFLSGVGMGSGRRYEVLVNRVATC